MRKETNMEIIIENIPAVLSQLLIIVAVLVAATNIITEVVKKVTWEKVPTNIVALIVALALSLIALFAFCQIKAVAVTWYLVVAAIVVGFLTAYAAMFGYDKLREVLAGIGKKE